MKTILLAVDESPEAVEAARRAHVLFGPDATYLAVNVSDTQPMWAGGAGLRWGGVYPYPVAAPYPLVEEEVAMPESVAQARSRARSVADEAGVPATAEGRIGDPATAILDAAEARGADVIVTGTSNKGWWRRLLDPSVSQEVVREARCPVLVVHAGDVS